MPGLFRLQGQVKHYDWGGFSFLPTLLGQENPGDIPFAEYWLGTHPQGPATILRDDNQRVPLHDAEPNLSFLLKVLDVREMLSIQVHPNRKKAQEGFVRETQSGISLEAADRNFKDPNHKPELMIALGEFWLLHGFRKPESLQEIFVQYDFLRPLQEKWESSGYGELYKWVMEMPISQVNEILSDPLHSLLEQYQVGQLSKSDPGYWAARAHEKFSNENQIDRGIFSIFLFNLVRLTKGQGIFQGAGVPHAYLEGQNVEIMASSDNVLRGGLTSKRIDVAELLRHVLAEPMEPMILDPHPDGSGFRNFPVPVEDFMISCIELHAGEKSQLHTQHSCILLVPEGNITVVQEGVALHLGSPDPGAFVTAGSQVELNATNAGLLFIATASSVYGA